MALHKRLPGFHNNFVTGAFSPAASRVESFTVAGSRTTSASISWGTSWYTINWSVKDCGLQCRSRLFASKNCTLANVRSTSLVQSSMLMNVKIKDRSSLPM